MSDAWQNMLANRSSTGRARPEQRLWLSHIGSVLSIVGLTIFLVTLAEATPLHWTIKPIVGVAFAGFGVQIITTICITCRSHAQGPRRYLEPARSSLLFEARAC